MTTRLASGTSINETYSWNCSRDMLIDSNRGDRYVEEYSRKGKLTQDLLETCNLDDIKPE